MANESDVRARIGKYLREHGFFVQAMETGAIADGVPDMWYSQPATEARPVRSGWLELKKVRVLPARIDTKVFKSMNHPLGIFQANWITKCLEAGTPANILVAYDRRYFFVPGKYADSFNDLTWPDLQKFEIKKETLLRYL